MPAAELLSLGISLALFSTLAIAFRHYTPDDTFIFLRYAENAAAGHGLVYNAGERVQGFTSPLWTVILASAAACGLPVLGFAKAAGALLGGSCIVMAWAIGRRLGATAAIAAPLVTAGFIDLPYWSISGMDTSLFAAACSLALLLTIRAAGTGSMTWAAAVWSIAALSRPEGVLFGAAAVAWIVYTRRPGRAAAAAAVAVFALPLAAWAIFAWSYYGDVIPATYWAKRLDRATALHKALILVRAFAAANDGAFVALAVLAALWHPARRPLALLAAFVALNTAYILWSGGDSWASHGVFRFAVPWLVPLAVLMAAGAEVIYGHLRAHGRQPVAAVTAVVVLAVWLVFPSTAALVVRPVGGDPAIVAHLNAHASPSDLLVVHDIGRFGYLTRLPVFDVYGLVEPWVARELRKESPGAYYPADARRLVDRILAREPRWVILKGTARGAEVSIAPESVGPDLYRDARFREQYRLVMAGSAEPFLLYEREGAAPGR